MTVLLDSWRSWAEPDKEKLLRELQLLDARRTYTSPGRLATVIAPSESVQTPALDILDQALIDAESGKQSRLIFSMPPQEGKSQRVSRMFPIWCLIRDPERRIAIASYADDIAMRWGRQIRDDINANPDLGLALHPGISAAREWQLDGHRGGVITTGVGGALTGRPVDVMIIDDPLKDREESESPTMRERCINFWRSKASTRLPEKSIVVLIMTRWHEDDLAGFLIREHPNDFKLINIPAQAEHVDGNPDCKCAGDGKCLGYEVLGREPGVYMESTRQRTDAGWDLRKRDAGSYDWSALFQGHPSPAEGGELKRHWWRRYPHGLRAVQREDQTMYAVGAGVVVMTIDCAFKDQDSSDYVCFQVWAAKGTRAWLLDQVCDRMSFTTTCAELVAFAKKWPQATRKFVEDKANGPAVISTLRGKVAGLIEYTSTDSKLARVRSIAPFVEAGDVEIPEDAPFTSALVDQCAAFPNGANDDMVDCLSLALIKLLLLGLGNQFMDDLVAEHANRIDRSRAIDELAARRLWTPHHG